MQLRLKTSFRPFLASEFLIALYLFIFIVLSGPRFGIYATGVGLLAIMVFSAEIVIKNRLHWLQKLIQPLLPFLFFLFLTILVIPLIPESGARVRNNVTGFLFLLIVFAIYRVNGKAPLIENTLLGSTIAIALMSATSIGGRARYQGFGGGSTGASSLSTIIGIAIFFGLKIIFIDMWSRLDIRVKRRIVISFAATAIFLSFQFIIFSSDSRQGLIWLLIASTFVGSFIFRRKLLVGVVLSIPGGVLFLASMFFALRETGVVKRFIAILDSQNNVFDPDKSFIIRSDMINRGLEMFLESPLWGNGNEAFRVHGGFSTYSHNNYIEILANYGILGLVFFYTPLIIVSVGSLVSVLRNERPILRIAWLWCFFGCSSVLVSNIFIPSYYMRPMLAFLGGLLGYYYFLKDQKVPFAGYQRVAEQLTGRVKSISKVSFH